MDSMLGSARSLILPAPTLAGTMIDVWARELRKGEGENAAALMTGVEARGVARVEAEGAS